MLKNNFRVIAVSHTLRKESFNALYKQISKEIRVIFILVNTWSCVQRIGAVVQCV